jgi:hypothetical protein
VVPEFIILQIHSVSEPSWTNIIFFLARSFTAFRFLILAEQKIFAMEVKNDVQSVRCHRHRH